MKIVAPSVLEMAKAERSYSNVFEIFIIYSQKKKKPRLNASFVG